MWFVISEAEKITQGEELGQEFIFQRKKESRRALWRGRKERKIQRRGSEQEGAFLEKKKHRHKGRKLQKNKEVFGKNRE